MTVIVITGGTAGVGRATADYFARAGYDVAVIARSKLGLQDTVKHLQTLGGRVLGISADVSVAAQVEHAANRVEAELGPVTVWVNAAMCTVLAPFSDISHDEYRRVTEVTYLGFVNGTREALRLMTPRNRGTIIQVGSALAYRSVPLQAAYCGAKAAIRGFTDSLRCELLHERSAVRLTMVHLPGVNTPQFDWARNKLGRPVRPVAPVYQPEVAAKAIFDAARRAPREIWVGKSTIQSIMGNMFFPGQLDRLMAKQAWEGQMQLSEKAEPGPDYLYEPVDGLHRSRGRFSEEAKDKAVTVDSGLPGRMVLAAAGLGIILLSRLFRRRR